MSETAPLQPERPSLSASLSAFAGAGPWAWCLTIVFVAIGGWVLWIARMHEPSNLAVLARVKPSSHASRPGLDPRRLVDGDPATEGVYTKKQRRPNVTLDLHEPHEIGKIVVHRPEGVDIPIKVEISLDGELWGELASRGGPFTEWTIESWWRARYIRVVTTKRGRLRLSEVEVMSL